jgi:CBS domain-containing protein
LWWRMGNLRRATRIASMFGSIFGVILVLTGLVQIVSGNTMGGTWQILIGIFLAAAASQARGQSDTTENLKGVSVLDLMERSPLTVGPDVTVDVLMKDYIYGLNRKFIVVADEGRGLGYIGPDQIRRVPQSQWHDTFVRTVAANFTHDTVVTSDAPAIEALRKIKMNAVGSLAVLEGSQLVGTVSEANFVNYLSVREAFSPVPRAAPAKTARSSR